MLFIVVDPSRFVALDTFEEQASRLLEEVTSSKKAEGVVEILYPGQRAEQEYRSALKKGLDIPDKIYDQVLKLRRM
jgi:LDH2 family malate/lactate/ureidoglycolate dehydrogenase